MRDSTENDHWPLGSEQVPHEKRSPCPPPRQMPSRKPSTLT